MNKQALTEALVAIDVNAGTFPNIGGEGVPLIYAAARLVERLLPGECEICGGSGEWMVDTGPLSGLLAPCPVCHGSGRVWDEGIVEAVAKAIHPWDDNKEIVRERARAVLSALVELLEKVET